MELLTKIDVIVLIFIVNIFVREFYIINLLIYYYLAIVSQYAFFASRQAKNCIFDQMDVRALQRMLFITLFTVRN